MNTLRNDPIVEEIRAHERKFISMHGNDIQRICEALRELENVSERKVVHREPNRLEQELYANTALQPTVNPLRGLSAAELGR